MINKHQLTIASIPKGVEAICSLWVSVLLWLPANQVFSCSNSHRAGFSKPSSFRRTGQEERFWKERLLFPFQGFFYFQRNDRRLSERQTHEQSDGVLLRYRYTESILVVVILVFLAFLGTPSLFFCRMKVKDRLKQSVSKTCLKNALQSFPFLSA